MAKGFIYILSNPSFKFLKIGFTLRDPAIRITELNTTGVPTPFEIIYEALVLNPEILEGKIHQELSEYRINDNREFFQVHKETAYNLVKQVFVKNNIEVLSAKDFSNKNSLIDALKSQNPDQAKRLNATDFKKSDELIQKELRELEGN